MNINRQWHSTVYGGPTKIRRKGGNWMSDDELIEQEFRKIFPKILKRDKYQCQRCRKKLPAIELSVHHINPRSRGGDNSVGNLITLCNPCHDFVELHIDDFWDIDLITSPARLAASPEGSRPSWHTWVYGGARMPEQPTRTRRDRRKQVE